MPTTFSAALLAAMTDLLRQHGVKDVVEVTSFEEETRSGGLCDTCGWTETVVEITYTTTSGTTDTYNYSGSLAKLIRALTD